MANHTIAHLLNIAEGSEPPQPAQESAASGQDSQSPGFSGQPSSPPAAQETERKGKKRKRPQEPLQLGNEHSQEYSPSTSESESSAISDISDIVPDANDSEGGAVAVMSGGAGIPSQHPKRCRTIFSSNELAVMEAAFYICSYPDSHTKDRLAKSLGFDRVRVMVWFQNRRARGRKNHYGRTGQPDVNRFSDEHVAILKEYERTSSHSASGYTPIFATQPHMQPQPQPIQPQVPFVPLWPLAPQPVVVSYPTYHPVPIQPIRYYTAVATQPYAIAGSVGSTPTMSEASEEYPGEAIQEVITADDNDANVDVEGCDATLKHYA